MDRILGFTGRRILRPFLKRSNELGRSDSGVAAVEFALVALPFIALTMAILETCLAFFAGQALESAVDESSRKIRTKQTTSATMTAQQFKTEICNNGLGLFNCANLHVDVQSLPNFKAPTTPKDSKGNFDPTGMGYSIGGSGQIQMVRAYYEWPVFLDYLWKNTNHLSNNKRLLVATTAFRIEP